MSRRVLIAYDGSDYSNGALEDLKTAGLGNDVDALIVSVAEVWLPPDDGSNAQTPTRLSAKTVALLDEAKRLAAHAHKFLTNRYPNWKVSTLMRSGSPAWELVAQADEWKPNLLIVGSQGQSALARVLLGSVSQRVLAEARCSVRIARQHQSSSPVRLLVGVDGSAGSDAAVKEVATRDWPVSTEVRVVLFDDPFVPSFVSDLIPGLTPTDEHEKEQSWANKVLQDSLNALSGSNLSVTTELREGDPKSDLPQLAEEWGADAIFIGSTGFSSRLERFVLGSVSEAVAGRAECTVEVVRHSTETLR